MESKYNKHTLQTASKLILLEQGSMGGFLSTTLDQKLGVTNKDRVEFAKNFWKNYHHEIMIVAEIGLAVVGMPYLSAAVAAADAGMYWNEGDKYTAGFIAVLTAIPVIGALAAKIPGVKQLGTKGIRALAKKLTRVKAGEKVAFTKTEAAIVKAMGKHPNLINKEIRAYTKRLARNKKIVKATSNVAGAGANYAVGKLTWDSIYANTGLQIADIEGQTKPELDALKAYADKLK